jgi:hypothetical protein
MSKRVAEFAQLLLVELLLLVGDVLALAGLAQAVALDGAGQDHRRRALVLTAAGRRRRPSPGRGRPAAAWPAARREVLDQLQQLRVLAEEVLADVGAALDDVLLVLAVHHLAHALDQQPVVSAGQQGSQSLPQMHLDHVPAGAAEVALQLLDDLAVAAHRAVQPLQVAVDDEDQVVQLLARGQRDRAQRLRLVRLAVAQEGPDLCGPWPP